MRSRFSISAVSKFATLLFVMTISPMLHAQQLPVPPRAADAISGSAFKDRVADFSLTDRENKICQEILNGNIPDFLRKLIPISFSKTIQDSTYKVTYFVLPDYLAIGSNSDYFSIPMTPALAQKISTAIDFTLPTKLMADQIWEHASLKLTPSPIPPSPEMTSIPIMWKHSRMVQKQRKDSLITYPLGKLVAGNKKDVIISNKIYGHSSRRVVIYGWHQKNGHPIQPVYAGHIAAYADYSHGIRLVQDSASINHQFARITEVLQDSTKASLFSDEGVISKPFYPVDESKNLDCE